MSNRSQRRIERKLTVVKPSDPPAVAQEKRKVKEHIKKTKKAKRTLQKYANIYVNRKDELLPLMREASGKEIDINASHGELISLYIHLIRTNDKFAEQIQAMVDSEFNNALDPVTAIADAIGGVFGVVGQFKEGQNIQDQQDAYFERYVLEQQSKNDTTKILLITGISLIAVGGLIYVVMKKR